METDHPVLAFLHDELYYYIISLLTARRTMDYEGRLADMGFRLHGRDFHICLVADR